MAKTVALFSGQGSQYPGMGKELYDTFPQVRRIYECAADVLGFDVAKTSFEGTPEELSRTQTAQPLIFTHSLACFQAAKESLPTFAAVAGHSLGEYAALCCGGAYGMEDGMRIVKARAEAMEEAAQTAQGAMYAVVGSTEAAVEAACGEAGGFVQAVNYNLPSQTVISGELKAAEQAAALLEAQGAKAVRLAVGSAFHTSMMDTAAQRLQEEIGGISYAPLTLDFYSNLTGGKLAVEDYPAYFAKHMVSPVRFVDQVAAMAADDIAACVEFGPKKTAATLVKKNNRAFTVANVEDLKSLEKAKSLQQA